jgi:hypothetical protein
MSKLIIKDYEINLISKSRTTYDKDKIIEAVAELYNCSKHKAMKILLDNGCLKISDAKIEQLLKKKPRIAAAYWKAVKEDYSVLMDKKVFNKPFLSMRKCLFDK